MNEDLEQLRQQLEELRALRDRISVGEEEKEEQVEIEETDIRENVEEEISNIAKEIEELEENLKKTAKEYDESYKRFQEIINDYEQKTEDTKLLSEEEIQELRFVTEKLKFDENERSNEIKRRLDIQKKIISDLKRRKTTIENNIKNAEALGLSYDEYIEITSTMRKTSIMNSILEEKGLITIINKPAKERTKEEKELLKKTKQEILEEISEFKKDHDDYSVLDTIEALYSLETTYIKVETPRETKVESKELMVIKENTIGLPYRVINPNVQVNNINVEEAPKDMEGAKTNEKVDINELKPAEEKVTIFNDSGEYYVRKYAVDRFKLKSADLENEVRINGSVCYKISEHDVERIKENANNAFSPYIADIKEITLEKKNEISEEDTKDELIPGTKIKRPRDRKPYETDEEYELFLKEYYGKVFPPVEKEEKKEPTTETVSEKTLEDIINEKIAALENTPPEDVLSDGDIEEVVEEKLDKQQESVTEPKTEVEKDKYEAKNIKASEEFKEELKKNNVIYRIVHAVPKIVKSIIRKFKKEEPIPEYEIPKKYFEQDYVYEAMLEDKLIDEEEHTKTR